MQFCSYAVYLQMIFPTFPKPAMWSECDKQSKFLASRPIKNHETSHKTS